MAGVCTSLDRGNLPGQVTRLSEEKDAGRRGWTRLKAETHGGPGRTGPRCTVGCWTIVGHATHNGNETISQRLVTLFHRDRVESSAHRFSVHAMMITSDTTARSCGKPSTRLSTYRITPHSVSLPPPTSSYVSSSPPSATSPPLPSSIASLWPPPPLLLPHRSCLHSAPSESNPPPPRAPPAAPIPVRACSSRLRVRAQERRLGPGRV
jgi:hypothetical protein